MLFNDGLPALLDLVPGRGAVELHGARAAALLWERCGRRRRRHPRGETLAAAAARAGPV